MPIHYWIEWIGIDSIGRVPSRVLLLRRHCLSLSLRWHNSIAPILVAVDMMVVDVDMGVADMDMFVGIVVDIVGVVVVVVVVVVKAN